MINKQTTLDLNGPIISFIQQPSSLEISSGGSADFTGIATVTYPTQDPVNPAVNTGSIAYQWYVDGYGALSDGNIPALGFSVTGSATTTLTVSNAVSPTANGRRFYIVADHTPSAYSQPTGSAVVAGTARSTGSAFNDPNTSDFATLTVKPLISVTGNPTSQEVAEGDFATFTASGSSNDGTAVSIRWLLNGSYLSDNGSTVFGSNTDTLRISSSTASSNTVSAEISHPTASNSPLYTSSANFNVVVARAVLKYEKFYDNEQRVLGSGTFDLTQVGSFEFNTFRDRNDQSVMIYAPEKDVRVRITLAAAAGFSWAEITPVYSGLGGGGGVSVFEITLKQNTEYVFKLGGEKSTGIAPSGGFYGGGGMSIFYRQSEVLVVSGGGGGSGIYGNGGDGGGAGQSGSSGEYPTTSDGRRQAKNASPGGGGSTVSAGSLGLDGSFARPANGTFTDEENRNSTYNLGGKLSSCTYGGYWRNVGYSPCEIMGFVQGRDNSGRIILGSTDTISRGYKAGLAYRNNGGNAGETQGGAGGGGAYGGNGAPGTYNYSGGGGGSGYTNGEARIISATRGGNGSRYGYARIELA
jgi:hypothetical protein